MRLAIALTSFQALGEYDASIHDWEAKPAHNKMFTNFHPFIQHEFTKSIKSNNTSVKSIGKGIVNQAQEKDSPSEADQAAWALAEVASVMQAALEKQMEKLMELLTKSMETMTKTSPNPTPTPGGGGNRRNRIACKHCGIKHLDPDSFWELEKNKNKRPANWKPAAERKAVKEAKKNES